jgi:hypothetical protein
MRTIRHIRPILLATGVLVVVAACVYGLRCAQPAARSSKTFGRDVADTVRVWNPKTGVDCIRIKSCRLEKRKMGPVTLGGLNVLLLEDVVLNLPFPDDIVTNLAQSASVAISGDAESRRSGDDPILALLSGIVPSSVRASSIRISGLAVNRVEGDGRVTLVFAADEMRNRGKTLLLAGCRVIKGSATNFVGEAVLMLKPNALLTWEGGQLPLDDLFTKPTQPKQRNET